MRLSSPCASSCAMKSRRSLYFIKLTVRQKYADDVRYVPARRSTDHHAQARPLDDKCLGLFLVRSCARVTELVLGKQQPGRHYPHWLQDRHGLCPIIANANIIDQDLKVALHHWGIF